MNLLQYFSKNKTPQTEPIPGLPMVPNSAGGFSFVVDDFTRLDRFLLLGSEGGSYYTAERKLTIDNAQAVIRCAQLDAVETVRRIVAVSDAGRAAKNDYAVFALALTAAHAPAAGKSVAYAAVPKVCRTGTHLFQFAAASNELRGWGRGLRRALASWYTEMPLRDLAFQLTKYQQRDGWSHRDVFRLAHPKTEEAERNELFAWAVGKREGDEAFAKLQGTSAEAPLALVYALEAAKRADGVAEIVRLIRDYRLPREAIPTEHLQAVEVWGALLPQMPLTALLRNLATMTRIGLLADKSDAEKHVLAELGNVERLKKARIHPLALLVALKTYESGKSVRGSGEWTPLKSIISVLDDAFYTAFANVEPTGLRWMLGLDVSGSMSWGNIAGLPGITPRVGSVAMALVTAAVEKQHSLMAFQDQFVPLKVNAGMRLEAACEVVNGLSFGATDCARPMLHALETKQKVDVFVVYTDSETWHGDIHPVQALKRYREETGIAAKLIVVGLSANPFTVADPNDAGMMDVVGFDTSAPEFMSEFAKAK